VEESRKEELEMPLNGKKDRFKELLRDACCATIEKMPERLPGKAFYAFVLHPGDAFIDMAAALATRGDIDEIRKKLPKDPLPADIMEMLKEEPDFLEMVSSAPPAGQDLDVTVDEWLDLGIFPDTFEQLNDAMHALDEECQSRDIEGDVISAFFEDVITEVILELKSDGVFLPPLFESDVLLGIQFSDGGGLGSVKRVSAKVNSSHWHEKILAYCKNMSDAEK
jgi:hypothetical protein